MCSGIFAVNSYHLHGLGGLDVRSVHLMRNLFNNDLWCVYALFQLHCVKKKCDWKKKSFRRFINSIQFNFISVNIYHRVQCNIHIYIYNIYVTQCLKLLSARPPKTVTLSQDGELYYLPCLGVGQDTELGAYVMSLAKQTTKRRATWKRWMRGQLERGQRASEWHRLLTY